MMSDGFSDLVEEDIDLAIRVGPVTDASLVARRIGLSRRVAVATPGYMARSGRPEHPKDLIRHDCIVYDRLLSGASWSFRMLEGPLSVPVKGPIHVNHTEGVRAAILEGLGIGYVPAWHFVDGEFASGRIELLLKTSEPEPQPISAVYASRRFLAPKVCAIIDYLAAEFALDPRLRIEGI
jgi:DNA-binding transcriptional LysR family regulator